MKYYVYVIFFSTKYKIIFNLIYKLGMWQYSMNEKVIDFISCTWYKNLRNLIK